MEKNTIINTTNMQPGIEKIKRAKLIENHVTKHNGTVIQINLIETNYWN
jgi:hypothetical protein